MQVDVGKEEVKVALLSALLLPVRALESKGKKGKSLPVVPLIVGESMKWKKSYASLAAEVQAQAPELLKVYQTLQVTTDLTHMEAHAFLVQAADWCIWCYSLQHSTSARSDCCMVLMLSAKACTS